MNAIRTHGVWDSCMCMNREQGAQKLGTERLWVYFNGGDFKRHCSTAQSIRWLFSFTVVCLQVIPDGLHAFESGNCAHLWDVY